MAEKIKPVTKEEWNEVNKETRTMVEEYLNELVDKSPATITQYTSSLRIYFRFIKDSCDNVAFDKIKPRDYLKYQNSLTRMGMSSSGVKFKRSSVSAFNDWVITYYNDKYPIFHNYITKQIKTPPPAFKNPKEPLTMEELDKIDEELKKQEKWQERAYLLYTYSTGCRKGESMLLLKEVADYEPTIKSKEITNKDGDEETVEVKFYTTHEIRCKGSGVKGKLRKLRFDQKAMDAIKDWLKVRGEDDCPYMFISKYGGEIKPVSSTVFSYWCHNYFEPIVGRRVHPHLFRESRATNMVVHQGKDIESAQALLGHNSSETTKIYVIKDDSDDADNAFC